MKLLAIDTSSAHIVSGIVDMSGDEVLVLASSRQVGATMHAEVLAPSIAQVCDEARTALTDLDGIVVGLGPGPFTGLRVGIVTAASLGDALGLPVWGVCSLDALPGRDAVGRTLAVSDARRKELYFALYDGDRRLDEPSVATPADLTSFTGAVDRVVHAGADKYLDELATLSGEVIERYADPEAIVRVALRDGLIGGASSDLQPIYIRRPDAAEPKRKPRLDVTGPTGSPDPARSDGSGGPTA